jgi:hypothetical protein
VANTLIGSIGAAATGASGIASSFPGGVYKEVADQKRPAGAFLVIRDESTVEVKLTSRNRVEVRHVELAVYDATAASVTALLEYVVKPWFAGQRFGLDNAGYMAQVIGETTPAAETTDYAPKGGNRFNAATVPYRVWLQF